jgi:DNA modification methylase
VQIEFLKTVELVPYEKNAKLHNDLQIDRLARIIKEHGFDQPIVVDENRVLIKGHGRLLAAKRLGLDVVPVIIRAGLSETVKKSLRLSDNKIAKTEFDSRLLKKELADLRCDLEFDLNLTGFDMSEINKLLCIGGDEQTPEFKDAEATELEADAFHVQLGDIWVCGEHRILCGDSTDGGALAHLLDGHKPQIMVTDPPYGVKYDPTRRSGNTLKHGTVLNDDQADWSYAWIHFEGAVAYVWHADKFTSTVQNSLEKFKLIKRNNIIWNKNRFALSAGDYHYKHEPCLYAVREGISSNRTDDRTQSTVWDINEREDKGHGHPTQKPIECMARPIKNHTFAEVYDPFLGSGTTLIAAENLGRRCFAVELNPRYVSIALARWKKLTGKEPVRK